MKRKYDQVNSIVELKSTSDDDTHVESTSDDADVNRCGLYLLMGCYDAWRVVFSYMGVPEVYLMSRLYRPQIQFYNGMFQIRMDELFGTYKPIISFYVSIYRGSKNVLKNELTPFIHVLKKDSQISERRKEYEQTHHQQTFKKFEFVINRIMWLLEEADDNDIEGTCEPWFGRFIENKDDTECYATRTIVSWLCDYDVWFFELHDVFINGCQILCGPNGE